MGGELWEFARTGGGAIISTLLKIRNVLSEAAVVHRLALVHILDLINSGRFHLASRDIRVDKRSTGRNIKIGGIVAVIGQAHVFPSRDRQRIVNYRIDLRTFTDIY